MFTVQYKVRSSSNGDREKISVKWKRIDVCVYVAIKQKALISRAA